MTEDIPEGGLKIALVLYRRLTLLDLAGPYNVLARLPAATVRLVAATPCPVPTQETIAHSPA